MKIWIDADACPKMVKEIVFKASFRLSIHVTLVANNSMTIPLSSLVTLKVVGKKFDEADHYILDQSCRGDLVITADIPLAASLVNKGVLAINPRGEVYTDDNIQEILEMRDLMKTLRDGNLIQGGPPSLNSNFSANLVKFFITLKGIFCSFSIS